jgi:hypothetical protein
MGKEGGGSWHQCQRKIPVILRSLPKADDEESDRQTGQDRSFGRLCLPQDDGLIGCAALRAWPGVGSRNEEDFAFGIPAFAGIQPFEMVKPWIPTLPLFLK